MRRLRDISAACIVIAVTLTFPVQVARGTCVGAFCCEGPYGPFECGTSPKSFISPFLPVAGGCNHTDFEGFIPYGERLPMAIDHIPMVYDWNGKVSQYYDVFVRDWSTDCNLGNGHTFDPNPASARDYCRQFWPNTVTSALNTVDRPKCSDNFRQAGNNGCNMLQLNSRWECIQPGPCSRDPYADSDSDGICGDVDNCPAHYNPLQEDSNSDGEGDRCQDCAGYFPEEDSDADGMKDTCDNCPFVFDQTFKDSDSNGAGDACDNCPGSTDTDSDGVCSGSDQCPGFDDSVDADSDGVITGCDNCPNAPNPLQEDEDSDSAGDDCDVCPGYNDLLDSDGDTVPDECDLCQGSDDTLDHDSDGVANGCDVCVEGDDRMDSDSDGMADACDGDDDNDQVADADDGAPTDPYVCRDVDSDGCDDCSSGTDDPINDGTDTDGDGMCDNGDSCINSNPDDIDGDSVCDAVDPCFGANASGDQDSDGVCSDIDSCPLDNPNDMDSDGICTLNDKCSGFDDHFDGDSDGVPDGCDQCQGDDSSGDYDSDEICDSLDACPNDADNDIDSDSVCGGADTCDGFDDNLDADSDAVPDDCDVCLLGDDNADGDSDGVATACDVCGGFDDAVDTDSDGVPDGCDSCRGLDDHFDEDGDGIPDGCDNCPHITNIGQEDEDSDQVGTACDPCFGLGSKDTDSDNMCDDAENCANVGSTDCCTPDAQCCVDSDCPSLLCRTSICEAGQCRPDVFLHGVPCGDEHEGLCSGRYRCSHGTCLADSGWICDDLDSCTTDTCLVVDGSAHCIHDAISGCDSLVDEGGKTMESQHEDDALLYEAEQSIQELSASSLILTTHQLENAADSLRTAANANLTLAELQDVVNMQALLLQEIQEAEDARQDEGTRVVTQELIKALANVAVSSAQSLRNNDPHLGGSRQLAGSILSNAHAVLQVALDFSHNRANQIVVDVARDTLEVKNSVLDSILADITSGHLESLHVDSTLASVDGFSLIMEESRKRQQVSNRGDCGMPFFLSPGAELSRVGDGELLYVEGKAAVAGRVGFLSVRYFDDPFSLVANEPTETRVRGITLFDSGSGAHLEIHNGYIFVPIEIDTLVYNDLIHHGKKPSCVFFDETTKDWSTAGCSFDGYEGGRDASEFPACFFCKCNHNSDFSVLLSGGNVNHGNPTTRGNEDGSAGVFNDKQFWAIWIAAVTVTFVVIVAACLVILAVLKIEPLRTAVLSRKNNQRKVRSARKFRQVLDNGRRGTISIDKCREEEKTDEYGFFDTETGV